MTTFSTPIGTTARSLALLLLALTALTGRAVPLPPGQTLYDVTFGDGTFVAVGANGTIVSSVNGGAWVLRTAVVTPRLLKQTDAATYLGVSRTQFLADVDAGHWPKPLIRRGHTVLWDRAQLDAAIDAIAGKGAPYANAGWDDV